MIAKKFGMKFKEDENKNKEIEEANIFFNKCRDIKNSLKELYKRQKDEKEKRDKIDKILARCKDKFNDIKSKLNEYRIKERKLKEMQ